MKQISSATFEFGKIFAKVTECIGRAEVLMKDKGVKGHAKHFINTAVLNRLKAVRSDIITLLPAETAQVLKDDILSDESALQLDYVTDLFMALPKGVRDEVENYVKARYDLIVRNNP